MGSKVLSRLIQKSLLFSNFSEGGMFRILYYITERFHLLKKLAKELRKPSVEPCGGPQTIL